MAKASEQAKSGNAQGTGTGQQKEREKYFRMTKEEDFIRFLPPHNEDLVGMATVTFVKLPCKVSKKDASGNRIQGQFDTKDVKILNGKLHGKLSKDLLVEYLFFALKKMKERGFEKEMLKSAMTPINGLWSKDGKRWVYPMMSYQSEKAFYVYHRETDDIEILSMNEKAFKEKYIKLNDDLSTPNSPIAQDTICDVEQGQYVRVFKNAENKVDYSLERCPYRDPAQIAQWQQTQITPQEVLDKLATKKPIDDMYKDTFNRYMYDQQLNYLKDLEGRLKGYEAKHNGEAKSAPYNFLDDPEFILIAEGIAAEVDEFYPKKYVGNESNSNQTDATSSKNSSSESSKSLDDLSSMNRKSLKEYILMHELDVQVTKDMNEDDIRKEIRASEEFDKGMKDGLDKASSKPDKTTKPKEEPKINENPAMSGGFDTGFQGDDDGLPF